MELNWKDYLAMHWPYIAMGLLAVVSGIFTFGYKQGQHSILFAAERAAAEAKLKEMV